MVSKRLSAFGLLALVWTLLVGKAWLLRTLALQDPSIGQALLLEGPLLLGILLVVDAFFADFRLAAYTVVDLVLSLLMAATAVYAGYYNSVPSRETLAGVGQAASVTDSIASLVQPVHATFFADVLVLALISAVLWAMKRRTAPETEDVAEKSAYVFQHRWVYAAIVPALTLLAFGVVSVRTMPSPIDPSNAARARGVLTYQAATLAPVQAAPVASIELEDPAVVQERIDELMGSPRDDRVEGFSAGEAEGANVIVIQVEALQMAAFEGEVAGREIMPNLRRYASRSWYFPRGIAQVGRGTTSDAELISNASVYPATSGPSSVEYVDREIPSLPRLLGKRGYESFTFHTNSAEFWNRHQLYAALGFTRYYDREFFGTKDAIAFGASDEVLFEKTLSELESKAEAGKPFYAQIVTMSSHHPFIGVPRERVPLQLDETFADTMTGRYVEEQSYVDAVLGRFLDRLEKSRLAENTMVVIYGDHFGLPTNPDDDRDAAARRALLGDEYSILERHNVPLIVHLPGQSEGRVVERPVGQVDLMPTIADALGVGLDGVPHFGRSVFASPGLMPAGGFMAAGTYLDDSVLFVPGVTFDRGTAYDALGGGEKVDLRRASRLKWERMRELVLLSDAYVRALPQRADYDPSAEYVLPE